MQGRQLALKPSPGWSAPCWLGVVQDPRVLVQRGCAGRRVPTPSRASGITTAEVSGLVPRGEPGGCEVVLVTRWPCSSSKVRGLMQGGREAPARTDAKGAALRFLHAKRCSEKSCELASSQEQDGGNPAGKDPQEWWGGNCRRRLKSQLGPGAADQLLCCSPSAFLQKPSWC